MESTLAHIIDLLALVRGGRLTDTLVDRYKIPYFRVATNSLSEC